MSSLRGAASYLIYTRLFQQSSPLPPPPAQPRLTRASSQELRRSPRFPLDSNRFFLACSSSQLPHTATFLYLFRQKIHLHSVSFPSFVFFFSPPTSRPSVSRVPPYRERASYDSLNRVSIRSPRRRSSRFPPLIYMVFVPLRPIDKCRRYFSRPLDHAPPLSRVYLMAPLDSPIPMYFESVTSARRLLRSPLFSPPPLRHASFECCFADLLGLVLRRPLPHHSIAAATPSMPAIKDPTTISFSLFFRMPPFRYVKKHAGCNLFEFFCCR